MTEILCYCPKGHEASKVDLSFNDAGTMRVVMECKFCRMTYETDHYGVTSPRLMKREWGRQEKNGENKELSPPVKEKGGKP